VYLSINSIFAAEHHDVVPTKCIDFAPRGVG